jgi:hypothetical protein
MKKGICPDCAKEGDNSIKFLTKHSLNPNGHHLPPFIKICRRHHDKRHGMAEPKNINKKFQKGTPKWKKKRK